LGSENNSYLGMNGVCLYGANRHYLVGIMTGLVVRWYAYIVIIWFAVASKRGRSGVVAVIAVQWYVRMLSAVVMSFDNLLEHIQRHGIMRLRFI